MSQKTWNRVSFELTKPSRKRSPAPGVSAKRRLSAATPTWASAKACRRKSISGFRLAGETALPCHGLRHPVRAAVSQQDRHDLPAWQLLKRYLKPLAKLAGIFDMTYQALRRTCATHFQKHGNPREIQSQLRHSKLEMTGRYVKAIPDQVRAAVEKMDRELCHGTEPGGAVQ